MLRDDHLSTALVLIRLLWIHMSLDSRNFKSDACGADVGANAYVVTPPQDNVFCMQKARMLTHVQESNLLCNHHLFPQHEAPDWAGQASWPASGIVACL